MTCRHNRSQRGQGRGRLVDGSFVILAIHLGWIYIPGFTLEFGAMTGRDDSVRALSVMMFALIETLRQQGFADRDTQPMFIKLMLASADKIAVADPSISEFLKRVGKALEGDGNVGFN